MQTLFYFPNFSFIFRFPSFFILVFLLRFLNTIYYYFRFRLKRNGGKTTPVGMYFLFSPRFPIQSSRFGVFALTECDALIKAEADYSHGFVGIVPLWVKMLCHAKRSLELLCFNLLCSEIHEKLCRRGQERHVLESSIIATCCVNLILSITANQLSFSL